MGRAGGRLLTAMMYLGHPSSGLALLLTGPDAFRLKTIRRPPIYPNGAQAISPVAPSSPFRCPHAVHRYPSVDLGLPFDHFQEV